MFREPEETINFPIHYRSQDHYKVNEQRLETAMLPAP